MLKTEQKQLYMQSEITHKKSKLILASVYLIQLTDA